MTEGKAPSYEIKDEAKLNARSTLLDILEYLRVGLSQIRIFHTIIDFIMPTNIS
ncbi:MAG: hypothetical protein ACXQT4_07800 [Methanotrichaceae archaeon]